MVEEEWVEQSCLDNREEGLGGVKTHPSKAHPQ
jgi:hypothetical protein